MQLLARTTSRMPLSRSRAGGWPYGAIAPAKKKPERSIGHSTALAAALPRPGLTLHRPSAVPGVLARKKPCVGHGSRMTTRGSGACLMTSGRAIFRYRSDTCIPRSRESATDRTTSACGHGSGAKIFRAHTPARVLSSSQSDESRMPKWITAVTWKESVILRAQ